MDNNLLTIKSLLTYYADNLNIDHPITIDEINPFFADKISVKANAKHYQPTLAEYCDSLNLIRLSMKKISYDIEEFILAPKAITVQMKSIILRQNEILNHADILLLVKFDIHHKIVLWNEKYITLD